MNKNDAKKLIFDDFSIAMKNQLNFESFCYELYKMDWVHEHILYDRQKIAYMDYVSGCIDSNPFEANPSYSFDDYLEDFGYNGEIYACFEEFLDVEYQDEDYMKGLLENNEQLLDKYNEYIKQYENERE